jgi:hypothetical protein
MRAQEFVIEPKLVDVGGIKLAVKADTVSVYVRALASDGARELGHVYFDRDGSTLVADELKVNERFRGQGIAKIMYDYVKSMGFEIKRSADQTDDGRAFWDRNRGSQGEVWESVSARQVLQYVKQAHAPEEFDIEYSITDHPKWQLANVPLSQLKLDPDGEQQDPYRRVNWVDYDKVAELVPRIGSVLQSRPIVVDAEGWIIDGNHRATAAAEAGLTSVPAYVPATKLTESFNRCYDRACQLYDRAEAKGIDATLLQVADYQGDGSTADARWQRLPQRVWQHYVTVIGDTVYDPTAEQFGAGRPKKYSVDELKSQWGKIYTIRSTAVNENSTPDAKLSYIGNCTEDDVVDDIFGNVSEFARMVELHGDEFTIDDLVVKYDDDKDIHYFYHRLSENFADGKIKGKSRPGRFKRAGVSCKGSVTSLRKKAKNSSGERQKGFHWCANMKSGKKK